MSTQYQEKVARFFEKYTLKRREWLRTISVWKEQGVKKELCAQIEALMAQIEDYHSALAELLAQDTPDMARIQRLEREMRKCYKELVYAIKPVWRQWLEAIVVAGTAAFIIRTYVFGLYHVPTGSAEPNVLVGDRLYGNKLAYLVSKPKHGELVILDDPEFVYDASPLQRLWQKYVGFPILGVLKAGPQNWLKRVIAVPGDVIEGRMEDGKTAIYRNGEKLDETYVNPHPLLTVRKTVGFFPPHTALGSLMPWFLQTHTKHCRYTYDESQSFAAQQYYTIFEDEVVVHPHTGEQLMYPSGSPSYNRYGRNVDVFGPFTVPEGKYWVQGDSRLNSRDSRFWGFLDGSLVQGRASFVVFSLDSEEPLFLFSLLKSPWSFFTKVIRWNRFFKKLWGIPQLRAPRASEDA